MIVVEVLITSCQVSENLKIGPLTLHPFGLLVATGVIPMRAFLIALGIHAGVVVVNQFRTLVAHLWENDGEVMTVTGQYLDSVNVPPPGDAERTVEVTRLGARKYVDAVESRTDPQGRAYYWIGGPPTRAEDREGDEELLHDVPEGSG